MFLTQAFRRQNRQVPGPHCPAILTRFTSSRFNDRPRLKNKKVRDWRRYPTSISGLYTHVTVYKSTHAHTCTYTPIVLNKLGI